MHDPEMLKKKPMDLDIALEAKDFDLIKSFFDSDCENELIGVKLAGIQGVEKWLNYIFKYGESFKLDPVVIMLKTISFLKKSS